MLCLRFVQARAGGAALLAAALLAALTPIAECAPAVGLANTSLAPPQTVLSSPQHVFGTAQYEEGIDGTASDFIKRGGPVSPTTFASWHGFEALEQAARPANPGVFKSIKHFLGKPVRSVKKAIKGKPKPATPTSSAPVAPTRGAISAPSTPLHPFQPGYEAAVKAQEQKVLEALAKSRSTSATRPIALG